MGQPAVRRAGALGVCARLASALLVAGWLALLFFQHGQSWDESEHAHAAWLISQGKSPLTDFFQHHQPLLWSLLALYFRVGLRGPDVLIWGRILVVLSGWLSVIALVRFGREAEGCRFPLGAGLGVAAFIVLTVLLSTLFVIRPETISVPLLVLAVYLWSKPGPPRRAVALACVAGLLAGAAVYSSPRFVLLGGFFVLLGAQTWRRWLGLVLGGMAFLVLYTVAAGYALDKVVFNVEYSALLQRVGLGSHGLSGEYWTTLMCFTCLPMAALLPAVHPSGRWRGAALLANTLLVFLLCDYVAGHFRYSQAFAPFVTAVALTGSWIGARLLWPREGFAVLAAIAGGAFVMQGLSPSYFPLPERIPRLDFLRTVRFHEWLARSMPAGATVLAYAKGNPITVPDASYYGVPLRDGQNRLCRAIRRYRTDYGSRPPLPPCNFLHVILRDKPYLIEDPIGEMVSANDAKRASAFIKRHYRRLVVPRALRPKYFGIMVRLPGQARDRNARGGESVGGHPIQTSSASAAQS